MDKYLKIRDQMGTFDRLEFHSNSPLGWAIRLKTGDWSNHTGAVIIFNEYGKQVFCMESLEKGPDANRLSLRLEQYKGGVRWYPLKKEYHHLRAELGTMMLANEGIKYDIPNLIKNLFGRPEIDPRKLYCSEYITYAGILSSLPYDKNYLNGKAPRPGSDMQGLGWWEEGQEIL